MPRRERQGPEAMSELSEAEYCVLIDEVPPDIDKAGKNAWDYYYLRWWRPGLPRISDRVPPELWAEFGEQITAEWAEAHPGTRPTYFWRFTASAIETTEWMQPDRSGFHDHRPPDHLQLAFLRRHDLLTEHEKAALAPLEATR
jgi:hypothetical protein